MAADKLIRAAIYARVSTQHQEDEGTSLDSQVARCTAHAEERGYTIVLTHRETFSGGELYRRPRLTELREAARAGEIDAVIAYAVDRLSRDQAHLYILADEFERVGMRLEFVTEDFENSAVGKFIRSAKAFAGEVEREKIKERSIRGKRTRLESGRPLAGGTPPFGYRWRDDARTGFELDPEIGLWARQMFEWAAAGATLREIARRLNDARVATPQGKSTFWAHTTVRGILTNPTYGGRRVGFRWMVTKAKSGGVYMRERPADERIALPDGVAPGVVPWETFAQIQHRLRLNQERAARNRHDPESGLLRGFAKCGHCGGTMTPKSVGAGGRYRQYRCIRGMLTPVCDGSSISVRKLDAVAWAHVESILTRPEIVAAELERVWTQDPTAADLESAGRALAEVERQQRNLVDQLALLGPDTAAVVREKLTTLEEARRRLSAERDGILVRQEAWRAARGPVAQLEAWCRAVASNLGTLDYDQKRLALDALGVKVRVWRAKHEPRYEVTANLPFETRVGANSDRLPSRSEGRTTARTCAARPEPGSPPSAGAGTAARYSGPPPVPARAPPGPPRPAARRP